MKRYGPTPLQAEVMRAIERCGGRTTARNLAEHMNLTPSAVWRHVKLLMKKGLIKNPFTPKTNEFK